MKYMPSAVTQTVARQVLMLQKHSPRLLFVAGVVGTVTSTVLACKATLKLPEVLEDIEHEIAGVKDTHNGQHQDVDRKDLVFVYAKGTLEIGKLYAPAIIIGVSSVGALTGSHVTLTRRNAGLTAAYAAVAKGYDDYRDRVRDALGEEKELDLYHATTIRDGVNADGKKTKVAVTDTKFGSPYARFFDSTNRNWKENQEYNRMFVQCQQNYANHLLNARGHVFLNEIYDSLGFDHTSAGAVTGWVRGNGDDYIDFGIFDVCNADLIVFGENADLLLDFNVDGVVYDLLELTS